MRDTLGHFLRPMRTGSLSSELEIWRYRVRAVEENEVLEDRCSCVPRFSYQAFKSAQRLALELHVPSILQEFPVTPSRV